MGNNIIIEESGKGGIILYQAPDGQTSLEVKLENETVWLTQAQICTLFDKSKGTISEHISNVFKEGELAKDSVVREFRTTAADGKTYITKYYSLDVIISVGYRVKSKRGTQFRIWANSVLKDYLIKGYAVKNSLIQERYDELKALVDTMGRAMQYLETGAGDQKGDQMHQILDLIKRNPKISRAELSDKTGLHDSSVKRRLKALVDEGFIQRIGPDKGGYWQLLK